jgi:hypothetical protein
MPRKKNYVGKKAVELRPADYRPDWRNCSECKVVRFWSLGPALRHCPRCKPIVERRRAGLSKQQIEATEVML